MTTIAEKLIVGLTGGIGSGKTAASDWFALQGIVIVDADIVAREIVAPGQIALQQIQQQFGSEMLLASGELNRSALRQIIFTNTEAKEKLEAITHPKIRQQIMQQLADAGSPYVILVSPLLFETNQHQLVDRSLLIDVEESLQLSRASQRDGQSAAQIERIVRSQMPRHGKRKRADDIVENNADLSELHQQLNVLHHYYLSLANQRQG